MQPPSSNPCEPPLSAAARRLGQAARTAAGSMVDTLLNPKPCSQARRLAPELQRRAGANLPPVVQARGPERALAAADIWRRFTVLEFMPGPKGSRAGTDRARAGTFAAPHTSILPVWGSCNMAVQVRQRRRCSACSQYASSVASSLVLSSAPGQRPKMALRAAKPLPSGSAAAACSEAQLVRSAVSQPGAAPSAGRRGMRFSIGFTAGRQE